MGCQCTKKNEEKKEDEIEKEDQKLEEINNNGNILGLKEKEEGQKEENKKEEEDYLEHLNEEKNAKYADYPDKMVELINKIRQNPVEYAKIVEDSIKNITSETDKNDETKAKLIYKHKVKVALNRGEDAFKEAVEILRNMEPLPPLEFNGEICIPLPQTEEEIKDPTYLKEQVKILKETTNIDIFFKDLIKIPEVSSLLMVVDDSIKNAGRKREALLNKDYKYIGINSHFIGKTFVAYFSFSK
jgi:hypothetical protein